MLLKKFAGSWISAKTIDLKPRSKETYLFCLNNLIVAKLGDEKIEKIDEDAVQRFVVSIVSSGYSASTVRSCFKVLKNCLTDYCEKYNTKPIKFGNIKIPAAREKKVECFSEKEQKMIEQSIDLQKNPRQIGILLSLYTGIRLGELLALKWSDVDMAKGLLHIEKTAFYQCGKLSYTPPKTKASVRSIPIPNFLLPLMRECKRKSQSEFVITDKNGAALIPRTYQYEFEALLKKSKIAHKGFHSLRHTFATRAVECGMDIKSLADILGHANPMITLKRYTHSMWDYKKQMMNKIGKIYSGQ